MCSIEFKPLKWDWDIQFSGHSYISREERSPNTGLTSSLPVFVNDQRLQRIVFVYFSLVWYHIKDITLNYAIASGTSKSYVLLHYHQYLGKVYIHKTNLGQAKSFVLKFPVLTRFNSG